MVVVGIFILNVFVPVHTLELLWTKGNVVKPWLFKVKKLTNWLFVFAVIVEVGNEVLKLFVFVHTLALFWTKGNVVNPWLFKVKSLLIESLSLRL